MTEVLDMLQPHIRRMEVYQGVEPTEVLAQRAGVPPEKVIRLTGNENPYGPSPKVADALANFKGYNLYPDPEQRRLRDALSQYLDVEPGAIVAGNGSDEIIDLILRMFLAPGEKIIDPAPTFGMYAVCARICGGEVVTVPRDDAFDIDIEGTELAIDSMTKVLFTASPNNPTGNICPEWQVRRLLQMRVLVVVDEAYYEFCGQSVLPLVEEYPNLIVLRTFSKWAGLAGLRIGLGVMHPDIARYMMGVKPPYNVSLAAEVALLASLEGPRLANGPGQAHRGGEGPHVLPSGGAARCGALSFPGQLRILPASRGEGQGRVRGPGTQGCVPALLLQSPLAGLYPDQRGPAPRDGPGHPGNAGSPGGSGLRNCAGRRYWSRGNRPWNV